MRDSLMSDPAAAAAAAAAAGAYTVKTLGFMGMAGIAAGAVAIALTPPKSRKEFVRRLIVTVLTSMFAGPTVIEWGGFAHYSLSAQVGICFMVGVPAWLIWTWVMHYLESNQNKTPAQIANELRKVRK